MIRPNYQNDDCSENLFDENGFLVEIVEYKIFRELILYIEVLLGKFLNCVFFKKVSALLR